MLSSRFWLTFTAALLAVLVLRFLLAFINSQYPKITRRYLRPAAIWIGIISVVFGLTIIYQDRPSPVGSEPSIDASYHCSKPEDLEILEVPTIKVAPDEGGGFSGEFVAKMASQGKHGCSFQLTLPRGSRYEYAIGPTPQHVRGNVAGGIIPPYPTDPNKESSENFKFDYAFDSPQLSTWPDGLARQIFNLAITIGGKGRPLPVVSPAGAPARSLELRTSCPDNYGRAVNVFPSYGEFLSTDAVSADEVSWPVEPGSFGPSFAVICENSDHRFWVDHATDVIVLGFGVLLSVMVERRTREGPEIVEDSGGTSQHGEARNGEGEAD